MESIIFEIANEKKRNLISDPNTPGNIIKGIQRFVYLSFASLKTREKENLANKKYVF